MSCPIAHPMTAYSVVTRSATGAPHCEPFDTLAEAADALEASQAWDIPATVMHGDQDMTAEATALVRAWIEKRGEEKPVWIPKAAAEFDGQTLTLPEPLALDKGLI